MDIQSMDMFDYLPNHIKSFIQKLQYKFIEEIRLRCNMPLSVVIAGKSYYVGSKGIGLNGKEAYIVSENDIDYTVKYISKGSLYCYDDAIRAGYITTDGGHRVGIAGNIVCEENKIKTIKDISALNFRYTKQITGAADEIINAIISDEIIKNTLIISSPGIGKTTMLRDIARQLANRGIKVCIVDERHEIAAMVNRKSSFDIGINTDVLDNCPKCDGIMMAIRTMSPQVIITDEIDTEKDFEAVKKAASCGVAIITSMHCDSRSNLTLKENSNQIFEIFNCIITLSKNENKKIFKEIFVK